MRQTSLDVIQLFDIDLGNGRSLPKLRQVFPDEGAESETFRRFSESFEWLFDPQLEPVGASGDDDPTIDYLYQSVNCAYSLPNFDRFGLPPSAAVAGDRGGAITISEKLRVAVLSVWNHYDDASDAVKLKRELSTDIPPHYKRKLSKLFPNIAEAELMLPFVAVRYDSRELADVISRDGVSLGELFSGGLDHEPEKVLSSYLADNLSIRKYEGFFLRPSDALGVYTSGVENSPEDDEDLYLNTVFRAVQVCELCLLARRLLRSFKLRADRDAKKVGIFPRPFLVEKRRNELLSLELDMVKALPFRSPEAPPLVRKAQQKFSVPQYLEDAKDSYAFLESRYQNSKTAALAILAIVTYICDKLHFWDWISPFHTAK
jgi:hypothetical protein